MESSNQNNHFIDTLYDKKNPVSKIPLDVFNIDLLFKSHKLNKTTCQRINRLLNDELPRELNYYLALDLLPQYTDILADQKQIVPDYYDHKKDDAYYDISNYNDFQQFALTAFWNKSISIDYHFFRSIYQFIEPFVSKMIATHSSQEKLHKRETIIRDISHALSRQCQSFFNSLALESIFTLYQMPDELDKLEICQKRSNYFNRHKNQKQQLNDIFQNIIDDTGVFEKTIVFISGSSITRLSTEHIKNALRRKPTPVAAIQAHLKVDPLFLYEMNDYLSVIVIEPTHLKIQCDTVKIYKGFTLDRYSGLFSICPNNLKSGLKKVKNHWIFRHFDSTVLQQ